MEMNAWEFEEEQWNSGVRSVCGVDEAGAGPLAGPVYAAGVVLPPYAGIEGLDDSQKLTERRRGGPVPGQHKAALGRVRGL